MTGSGVYDEWFDEAEAAWHLGMTLRAPTDWTRHPARQPQPVYMDNKCWYRRKDIIEWRDRRNARIARWSAPHPRATQ